MFMDRNDPENELPRRGGGRGGGGGGGPGNDDNGDGDDHGGGGGFNPDTGRKRRGRPPKNPKPPPGPDSELQYVLMLPWAEILSGTIDFQGTSKPRSKPKSVRRTESAPVRTATNNTVVGLSWSLAVNCHCGSPAGARVTNSSGKTYYKCGTDEQCGFFQWADSTSTNELMPTQVVPAKRLSSTASYNFHLA